MRQLKYYIMLGFIICATIVKAQIDPHFTQYYASPMWLNPAMTGVIDGNYRATANSRNQWSSVATPLVTNGISLDAALPNNFGIGLMVLNQTAGDGGYNYTNSYLSLSYQVHLSEYKRLSGGFQLGFIYRGVDPTKLKFGNQFNPLVGYDPSLPSNEIFSKTSAYTLDGSVGVMYYDGDPNKKINPFVGVSLYHPTQPTDKFLQASNSFIPIRYSFHAGTRISVSDLVQLTPHVVYEMQGAASELAGGLYMNYTLDYTKDLIAGVMYRNHDAIAPNIGINLNGFIVGLSYDINISSLNTASQYRGAYEISISYVHRKKIPATKFICPRL